MISLTASIPGLAPAAPPAGAMPAMPVLGGEQAFVLPDPAALLTGADTSGAGGGAVAFPAITAVSDRQSVAAPGTSLPGIVQPAADVPVIAGIPTLAPSLPVDSRFTGAAARFIDVDPPAEAPEAVASAATAGSPATSEQVSVAPAVATAMAAAAGVVAAVMPEPSAKSPPPAPEPQTATAAALAIVPRTVRREGRDLPREDASAPAKDDGDRADSDPATDPAPVAAISPVTLLAAVSLPVPIEAAAPVTAKEVAVASTTVASPAVASVPATGLARDTAMAPPRAVPDATAGTPSAAPSTTPAPVMRQDPATRPGTGATPGRGEEIQGVAPSPRTDQGEALPTVASPAPAASPIPTGEATPAASAVASAPSTPLPAGVTPSIKGAATLSSTTANLRAPATVASTLVTPVDTTQVPWRFAPAVVRSSNAAPAPGVVSAMLQSTTVAAAPISGTPVTLAAGSVISSPSDGAAEGMRAAMPTVKEAGVSTATQTPATPAAVTPAAQAAARPVTPAPAGVVFAPAIAAAEERERQVQPVTTDSATPAPVGAAGLALPVAATARADPSGQAALDLTQPQWPHQMIQRIETLRDAADAADTRIRLIPDALGAIDVAVKRDGDTLHVQFTAEQAQTRQLLADAQPRLAEAAEARGLKLGQTSVDAGTTGGNGQPSQQAQGGGGFQSTAWGQGAGQGQSRPQHQSATPARPASALSPNQSADPAADDARIA